MIGLNILQLKLGNIRVKYSPISNCAVANKYNIQPPFGTKTCLGIFPWTLPYLFLKAVCFSEYIMSTDKYLTISWHQTEVHIHLCFLLIRYMIGPVCRGSTVRPLMQSTFPIFSQRVFQGFRIGQPHINHCQYIIGAILAYKLFPTVILKSFVWV